jgi:hypothetical protein
MNLFKRAGLFLTGVLLLACGSGPSTSSDQLDAAIRETSDYLNKQLPKGNKLVVLNIQSEFPALSEYIIDELIANTVNDRVFSVVDRQQLNTIRAELDFQMSGEVDDNTAQALGRMAGAQIIISGAISRIGDLYRLRVRALSVQTASIEGQFNRNIPDNPTVAALVRSQATGYGDAQTAAAPRQTPSGGTAAQVPAQATVPPPAPATPPAPTYKVGDTGPAGGLIFYDKGNNSGGWRYLEVASRDAGNVSWGTGGHNVSGTRDEIGTGKQNTQRMVNYMMEKGENHPAAMVCQQYSQGGYSDWFLPSKAELNLMYWNLKQQGLGSLGSGRYWSSSQYSTSEAWLQRFDDGNQGGYLKEGPYSVRPIRQF